MHHSKTKSKQFTLMALVMSMVKFVHKYLETQLLFYLSGHRRGDKEMAIPGSNKGIHLHYKGKPFGLMLILALSATLFGVMAIHKLREKRVLILLLKERERELYELKILLQKERDQAQEIRGNTQEVKDMIYTLSSQKRDLDVRILEMESMISSLKEDHQAMSMTLEDKANEIKTLREKEMDLSKKESEEASLREIVRIKETEIEDLTRRLDLSMQASNAHQDNMASTDEKTRSENAAGGSQDNNNNSQNQQQAVIREEVNEGRDQGGSAEAVNEGESNGVDGGSIESETKLQVVEESSELSAQPVRRSEVYTRRKRSKRLRAIARNRRMGKRRSKSIVRYTGEDKAQRGNGEGQSAPEAGTTNQGFVSPGFDSGGESGMIQNTVSKEENLSEKSAEENHQDTQMGVEVTSDVGEMKGAEGENTDSQGDDSVKEPQYSGDAGSSNPKEQGENAGTTEMGVNDGSSPTPAHMENANLIESSESLQETEPEDTNQYEANNNWNSSQGTAEEKEEKIDEPEF